MESLERFLRNLFGWDYLIRSYNQVLMMQSLSLSLITQLITSLYCLSIAVKIVSQARWGNSYANTSMRKVESILKFNNLSRSIFLFRLVLQVISVPFVV